MAVTDLAGSRRALCRRRRAFSIDWLLDNYILGIHGRRFARHQTFLETVRAMCDTGSRRNGSFPSSCCFRADDGPCFAYPDNGHVVAKEGAILQFCSTWSGATVRE